ncbi:MAG TPA: endonuclease domain-containing protein [Thermomicrobiales bacterium]|nr:endonuclease domain-containing protein [Thermomicrobiales bacterium]
MRGDDRTTAHVRGAAPRVAAAAKDLRQRLTPTEQALWRALQRRQVRGLKFRCQHPVGPYVLDFYCPACKLAVEVDGDVHDEQEEQDEARTRHLEGYGYRVLRFRNEEVLTNLDVVLEQIAEAALGSPPCPPNPGGNPPPAFGRRGKRHQRTALADRPDE